MYKTTFISFESSNYYTLCNFSVIAMKTYIYTHTHIKTKNELTK